MLPAAEPAAAQTAPRFFPETGHWLQGGFLDFWNAHGGYAVFGPPLTDERGQVDSTGRLYTEQYLANAVFEYHTNLPAGQRIVLAPLGRLRYHALYPGIQPPMTENTHPAGNTPPRYFAATGHWLGGDFLGYWLAPQGGITLGQPITGGLSERDPPPRPPYNVQYFEYGELQWRPDLSGTSVSTVQPVPLGRVWLPGHPPAKVSSTQQPTAVG